MIDKKLVEIHFDRNAENYDNYANVQKKMADKLISELDKNKKYIDILEIGSGTGYLTNKLLKTFPDSKITAVDISENMVNYARSSIKSDNISFLHADIENLDFKKSLGKYDLIISNATFQWMNDLEGTLYELSQLLKHDGLLSFSIFSDGTFSELKESYFKVNDIMGTNYLSGQDFISIDNLSVFKDLSFFCSSETVKYTEYFENSISFLKSIKKVGASNSNRLNKCNSPVFIKSIMEFYNKEYFCEKEHSVYATYCSSFIKIRKR